MKQYQAYLFDLYGTLVDIHTDESRPSFWKVVAAYYTAQGAPYTWKTIQESYRALCAAETARLQTRYPDAKIEIDLLPVFRGLYAQKGINADAALLAETAWFFRQRSTSHLRAYSGAGELLDALRAAGRSVILLSNAQSCFTRPELERLGLARRFDRIYISSEIGFQKPDPRFFIAPLRDLGLDPDDCLMIGNDPFCDVGGAVAVGMDAVYVRSALSPKESSSRSCHCEPVTDVTGVAIRIPRPSSSALAASCPSAHSEGSGSPVLSLPRMDLPRLRRELLPRP